MAGRGTHDGGTWHPCSTSLGSAGAADSASTLILLCVVASRMRECLTRGPRLMPNGPTPE